jgi:hypothetical protein
MGTLVALVRVCGRKLLSEVTTYYASLFIPYVVHGKPLR